MAAVSLRLVVVVVVAVAVTISVRSAAATVTVEDACRHTKHEAYCVKVLSARTESKATADMPALAELALSLAAESGAEAASFVRNLEKMPGGMPPECLEGCLAKFQDAVAELRRSKAALEERRDAVGAKVGVSEARADGDTCMEECQKVEGGAAPDIVDRIGELGKLCAVALALTDASMSKRP